MIKSLPLFIAVAFVGCASVPPANNQLNEQAKKLAAPSEGNAAIYVYRSNSVVGAALKKDVWVDGECLGETARGTFFLKEVLGNKSIQFRLNQNFHLTIWYLKQNQVKITLFNNRSKWVHLLVVQM